jgi:phenylacetate-CoA ligase
LSTLHNIYKTLPLSLQNLACSIEGWRIKKQRYNGNFLSLLNQTEERSTWSNDQIVEYRNKRLKIYLEYCQKEIPFYNNYFTSNGIDYRSMNNPEDLKILPVLTKRDISENIDRFISSDYPRRKLIKMYTSGSTGSPLQFYTTKHALKKLWTVYWRYRRWHGIDFNIWGAYLLGKHIVPINTKKPPFWRVNLPGKQLLLSGFHLNSENSLFYLDELNKRKIKWIYGYPSLIALLAKYKIEHGYELNYKINWITVNSENLFPWQNEIIKNAFNIKPVQHYGMAEAVANISECPDGSLHVDDDYSYVEFIKRGESDDYTLVGTNFSNYGMAFLRYEIDDIFKLSHISCNCGMPGRIVESIDGRKEDDLYLCDGTRAVRMSIAFKTISNIVESQIVQNNINEIIVWIVRGNKYSKNDEVQLLKSLRERTKGLVDIKIEYCQKIPRSKNGKLRLVISNLNNVKLYNK